MKTLKYSALVFLLICSAAYSQDVGISPVISPVTQQELEAEEAGFYQMYAKGWVIRPNLSFKQFSFSIENKSSGKALEYVPNVSLGIGCKGIYKGYGLGYTFALPQTEGDKGISKYQDFQFTFPLGKHGIDITYQNYLGFYVNDEALRKLNGGEYVQYSDLTGALIELSYYYAFNPDFSMKAAFNQTARQVEDAGSWLISSSLNAFVVSRSGGFIPLWSIGDFPELLGLDAMVFTGISISGGYAYTWVYTNDWFFTPSILVGTNFQNQTYFIAGGEFAQSVPFNPKISFKMTVGKHVDSYYFGAALTQNSLMAMTTSDIQFTGSTLNINIFYGIRL